jgi:SAM-dependent methyltransferase
MPEEPEGAAERARRRCQRGLFDTVARQYAATRPGYPPGLARFVAETAGAGPGTPVLEVGCGTGQLTRALLPFGFALTAIDVGASMIAVAREQAGADGVTFRVTPFEEFAAEPGSFGLVISGAAFHWIDPEVRFRQAARLLRAGGWLALAGYEERYDEPVGSALDALWRVRPADDGAWVTRPADAAAIRDSGLFGAPVQREFRQRLTRAPAAVIGAEGTRATTLSWPDDVRRDFFAELRERLGARAEVGLTLTASVTLAQVAR